MPIKWKDKAWDQFSRYIRMRDCLETTGTITEGRCVTCGRLYSYKKLQAGHCVPGRGNAILLHEQAVHAQCRGCNVFQGGRHSDYALIIIDRYGRDVLETLQRLSKTAKNMKAWEWEIEFYKYKDKADALEKENQ